MDDFESLFYIDRRKKYVLDPAISDKLYRICEIKPHVPDRDDSLPYTWDEMGMAELFADLYAQDCAYCPGFKSWYTYVDGVWKRDESAVYVANRVKEFVRLMAVYAGEIPSDDERKPYLQFVAKMGDRRFRERITRDAADIMCVQADQFDRNPYLINCKNGTYDLEQMQFREHLWSDYCTMQTNCEYGMDDSIYNCKRWDDFIAEVCVNDPDKMSYIQRALGYSMLGTPSEECMFILYGKTTRNGKSTLLSAIENLLGSYASQAPVDLICKTVKRDSEAASPVLARLKGRRFVTMSESDSAGRIDESLLKQFTGGEAITARQLYQAAITFVPQFTLWLSCNDLPDVHDDSLFSSNRLRVIEFSRHFKEDERDTTLKDFFRTSEAMSGILRWLIVGYLRYKQQGLALPDSMRTIIAEYRDDVDVIGAFLEEKVIADADSRVSLKDLYALYKTWCRTNGQYALGNRRFKSELEKHREFVECVKKTTVGQTVFGLKLKGVI